MAYGTVVLDIYEHGDRADELLAVVREMLGLWERLVPNEGPDRVISPTSSRRGGRTRLRWTLQATKDA